MTAISQNYDNSFNFTKAGFILPSITGAISCISSTTIMYIVIKSKKYTVYHRILFLMSSFDFLTSLTISLTTLPMPKDVVLVYPFRGPSYGTVKTCEAQGFIFFVGSGLSISMNAILNIYYLCVLRYKMTGTHFSNKVLPILLLTGITIPVIIGIVLVSGRGLLNPSPYESYCSVASYPIYCNSPAYPDTECIRGGGGRLIRTIVFSTIVLGFLVVIVTMSLIINTFCADKPNHTKAHHRTEDPIGSSNQSWRDDCDTEKVDSIYVKSKPDLIRTITLQASMYVGAFLLTWMWIFLSYLKYPGDGRQRFGDIPLIQVLKLIFQPLQGLYNLLIFLYHKIYNLQKTKDDLDFLTALKLVFKSPGTVPLERITNLTKVYEMEIKIKLEDRIGSSFPPPELNNDVNNAEAQNFSSLDDKSQKQLVQGENNSAESRMQRLYYNQNQPQSFVGSDLSFEASKMSSSRYSWTGLSLFSGSSIKNETKLSQS